MLTDKELAALVQVARLYYEDGLTQAQVAAKIGVSRPQVSKMLAHAREAGIVHIEIRPPAAGDAELLKLLGQRFGIKGGIVLPNAPRDELLRHSAVYLEEMLRGEKAVGLGWGYTLGEVAAKMALDGGMKGIGKIFPLIGKTVIPNRGYRVNELSQRRRWQKYVLTPACRTKQRRCVLRMRWNASRQLAVCFRTILMCAANLSAARAILPCAYR